jgi:hypothetical protein
MEVLGQLKNRKTIRKVSLGKPRFILEGNIKMDINKV